MFVLFATLPMVAEAKVKVVASFSILGDMVQTVTGNLAEVKTIVGPNADAHIYSPNVADAVAVLFLLLENFTCCLLVTVVFGACRSRVIALSVD